MRMAQQVNRRGWSNRPVVVPTEIELVETLPLISNHHTDDDDDDDDNGNNNTNKEAFMDDDPEFSSPRRVVWSDQHNATTHHAWTRDESMGGASTQSASTSGSSITGPKKKSLDGMLFVLWLKRHAPQRVFAVLGIWFALRTAKHYWFGDRIATRIQQLQLQQHFHQAVLPHQHRVVMVGQFGMGHRMSKLSAVYHFAHQVAVALDISGSTGNHLHPNNSSFMTHMEARWGVCEIYPQDTNPNNETTTSDTTTSTTTTTPVLDPDEEGGPIFEFLFGTRFIPLSITAASMSNINSNINNGLLTTVVPSTTPKGVPSHPPHKEVVVYNDCPRYYAGQAFKNSRLALPASFREDHNNLFFQKMTLDTHLFAWLEHQFTQHHTDATQFMIDHKFDSHTVIGLHLRAGNGEQNHFVQANRGIDNTTAFVDHLSKLLETLIVQLSRRTAPHRRKPWLLLVATDTPSLVAHWPHMTQSQWKIPIRTVSFPQPQLPPNAGVTYSALAYGRPCLDAWKAMMVDTVLLGHADVLVAATRSTFTQAMPLSRVLGKPELWCPAATTQSSHGVCPRFCEVSEVGTTMTCVQDAESWLFRNATNSWTLSTEDDGDTNLDNHTPTNSSRIVMHKVMVHFPDVDPTDRSPWTVQRAVKFFQATPNMSRVDEHSHVETLEWGKRLFGGQTINQKYRKKNKGYTDEWTFSNETTREGGA